MLAVIEHHCSVFGFFRYGFSNMRYIASLISGVGIFMMGAGLSWYHGIMGLLHPEPIESLLWVSVCVHSNDSKQIKKIKYFPTYFFLHCRLTVFWRALWCLKEVSYSNVQTDQISLCSLFSDICFFLSHITGCHQ